MPRPAPPALTRRGQVLWLISRSLSQWELNDSIHLLRESLEFPSFFSSFGVGFGALYASAYGSVERQQSFYEKFIHRRNRPLSFLEFRHQTELVRRNPIILAKIIHELPPSYPETRFQRQFVDFVYKDLLVPEDVGRQALAFCCASAVELWHQFNWPCMFVVRKRLAQLAKNEWIISKEELAEVVYYQFSAHMRPVPSAPAPQLPPPASLASSGEAVDAPPVLPPLP